MKNFSEEEWKNQLKAISHANKEQVESSTIIIEEIAKSVDAANLFITMVAGMSLGPAEQRDEARYGSVPARLEVLAYQLFPFFKSPVSEELNPWHITECRDALEKLFITSNVLGIFSSEDRSGNPIDRLVDEIQRHTKIVRGSAFPEQTTDEIIGVQGRFESWFNQRVGIGPNRAQEALWNILSTLENNANSFMPEIRGYVEYLETSWQTSKQNARKKSPNQLSETDNFLLATFKTKEDVAVYGHIDALTKLAPEIFPVNKDDLTNMDPPLTESEWNALIDLIGLTVINRSHMTDAVEVRQKPLFVLPDDRVLLVDISNALDVLWDEFERVAKNHQKFFQRKYQRRKANWLEDKAIEHLSKIFPSRHIYSSLTYPDPDKEDTDGAIAEIDAVIKWGPFLILIEAKARQFRLESQLGDVGRFRTDIKDNVEDAFEQARRALRYINQNDKVEFVENASQKKLTINKDEIYRIYLLTVSQHHLAGFATRLATLQDLGLFKDGEYPISISIADLGMVSDFCDGPDIFLHYIEKRLSIQKSSENILADELDFFGAYLDTRLQAERIWQKRTESKNYDAIWLSGWSDQFDAWMMYKRGELSELPIIKLDVPEKIQDILTELRRRNDDASKWIAFSILDMSDSTLDAIAHAFKEIELARPKSGMFRRFVYQEGEVVVSITASLTVSPKQLQERTSLRTVLEKYRRRVTKSIGFGVMILETSRPFEFAVWDEGAWQYDEELERLLEDEPPFLPSPGQKLPGRNKPCICGSGKKYKKCCLRKIEASRKRLS